MRFYNSTHNFYRGGRVCENLDKYNAETEIDSLEVVKGEEFGFFMSFETGEKSHVSIGEDFDLPWWGLESRYRIRIQSEIEGIKASHTGFVTDDDCIEKADIILNCKSMTCEKGEVPIFIEGIIPEDFKKDRINIKAFLYRADGYKREKLVDEASINIGVMDFTLEEEDNVFYLDLWQHPCSWARAYCVEYFSDEHFAIIERYLKEMKKLGQKVIDLVVSDFPWAGQKCFDIEENRSRLYEYNIVKVYRENGKLGFDFDALDRYVDLAFKTGIKDEINLFGIIGNWHGYDFGSPLTDYRDPIRVKVYDRDSGVYDYIRDRKELEIYLSALFSHLEERGLMDMVKVMGDEPDDMEKFSQYCSFLEKAAKRKLCFKYAICTPGFFEKYEGSCDSFSIHSLMMADNTVDGELIGKIYENSGKMTWYHCCFPDTLNIFIKSPLVESRLTGMYTYLWNMKGFLRWAYGIYVEDVYRDLRYKPERWPAGDMILAYPGKDGKVLHSLREKNLLYGIQDYNILRKINSAENDYEKAVKMFRENLNMNTIARKEEKDLVLDEFKSHNCYMETRNSYIKSYVEKIK